MVPRSGAPERRFFLERQPERTGVAPRLLPAEEEHARRVMRLRTGDALVGLDGSGRAWPLVVTAAERNRFEIAISGEPRLEPAPGEPGAALPWIEIAAPLPRGARAEEMLDRLVQLGAASCAPLLPERAAPEARAQGPARADRLARIAAEACKQSGRLWNLHFEPPRTCAAWLTARDGARIVRLDPRATSSLWTWLADVLRELAEPGGRAVGFTRQRPLCVAIGPEGGFTTSEEELFLAQGVPAVRLGPHVLRIETAAEAALAVLVAALAAR